MENVPLQEKPREQKGVNVVVNSNKNSSDPDVGVVQEIETEYGPLRFTTYGDITGPVFLTYHDVGTNHETCFKQFFKYAPQRDPIFKQFGVVHIDAPGQYFDASAIPSTHAWLDMDKLTEQILEVAKACSIKKFIGVGAGAGGYIMLNFTIKHPEFVQGLILLGATSRKCGWIEWVNKWTGGIQKWYLRNPLSWQNYFLHRWFSLGTVETNHLLVNTYIHEMERINQDNVYKFLNGFHRRAEITQELHKIKCRVALFVGDCTHLYTCSNMIIDAMGDNADWIKERECGLLLTAEKPEAMIQPISLMLQGMGFFVGGTGRKQDTYK